MVRYFVLKTDDSYDPKGQTDWELTNDILNAEIYHQNELNDKRLRHVSKYGENPRYVEVKITIEEI